VPRPYDISMRDNGHTSLIFLRPSKPSDAERELAAFQGTWTLKNILTDSWALPSGKGPDMSGEGSERRWVVKGNEITWTDPAGQEIKASFKIDWLKTPKKIDLTFLSGPDKGKRAPACTTAASWMKTSSGSASRTQDRSPTDQKTSPLKGRKAVR
jgi:uncharacterized protein (TIGR03067 family)